MNLQDLILRLHQFWIDQGCVVHQPYDIERRKAILSLGTAAVGVGLLQTEWLSKTPPTMIRPPGVENDKLLSIDGINIVSVYKKQRIVCYALILLREIIIDLHSYLK